VWARPGPDTQESGQPGWTAPDAWGQPPGRDSGPGAEERPGPAPQPQAEERPGWGPQAGWEQPTVAGGPPGWGPPAAPKRVPGRTPLVVGAGIALLVVVAVVAVLGLRGSGGQQAASPATVAPSAPGAGGGGGTGGGGGAASGALGAGSLRLPDQVGGLARIPLDDPSLAQGQQGLLDLITGSGTVDGWALGAYGPDRDDPSFLFMVVRTRQAETAGMVAGSLVDSVRDSLGGDLSEPRAFTRDGVRYDCYDGAIGSLCFFQDGATVGLGFGRGTDLDHLSQLTNEARRGVRS
jgi:hypothetical protein